VNQAKDGQRSVPQRREHPGQTGTLGAVTILLSINDDFESESKLASGSARISWQTQLRQYVASQEWSLYHKGYLEGKAPASFT